MCVTPKALYKIRLRGSKRVCCPQRAGPAVLNEGSPPVDPARRQPPAHLCRHVALLSLGPCEEGEAESRRGRQRAVVSAQLVAFCP